MFQFDDLSRIPLGFERNWFCEWNENVVQASNPFRSEWNRKFIGDIMEIINASPANILELN